VEEVISHNHIAKRIDRASNDDDPEDGTNCLVHDEPFYHTARKPLNLHYVRHSQQK